MGTFAGVLHDIHVLSAVFSTAYRSSVQHTSINCHVNGTVMFQQSAHAVPSMDRRFSAAPCTRLPSPFKPLDVGKHEGVAPCLSVACQCARTTKSNCNPLLPCLCCLPLPACSSMYLGIAPEHISFPNSVLKHQVGGDGERFAFVCQWAQPTKS